MNDLFKRAWRTRNSNARKPVSAQALAIISLFIVALPASAVLIDIGEAKNFTVLANTYNSGGDSSIVHGNVIAKTYASTGNGSTINGDYRSGDVLTLGDGGLITGNAESKGAGNVGANATVVETFVAGGVGTMGDSATVKNFISGGAGTIGANGTVTGDWKVDGLATISASAYAAGSPMATAIGYLQDRATSHEDDILNATTNLETAKAALTAMGPGTILAPTYTTDGVLFAGVYSAPSWSTTDTGTGVVIELDAQGDKDAQWIFNIDDILAFGANTNVVMIGLDLTFGAVNNQQVFWNLRTKGPGGYASIGANANIIGTIIAEDYIKVGAGATVYGASPDSGNCGGVYSTTSYVSVGAGAIIGSEGCATGSTAEGPGPDGIQEDIPAPIPEPMTYTMLLAGLGLMGFVSRRRAKKAA
jgi:predicted acyltransferase (DUF342 family)